MPLKGTLSERVEKLMDEGKPKNQAIAIAMDSIRRESAMNRRKSLPKRGQRINKRGK